MALRKPHLIAEWTLVAVVLAGAVYVANQLDAQPPAHPESTAQPPTNSAINQMLDGGYPPATP